MKKSQTLEISLCTRRTQRPTRENSELGERRRQQIHSCHKQGRLNWPPDDNASLMDHMSIDSLGELSTSKSFLVFYLEKEVKMTMTNSKRMDRERGRHMSA